MISLSGKEMATLYLAPSIQKSVNPQLHIYSSSSPGGFKSHELGILQNRRRRYLRIQMSWDGPLTSVKLILQGRNFKVGEKVLEAFVIFSQLTPRLKSFVEKKLGKAVEKHSHLVREVDVRLSAHGGEFGRGPRMRRCEVTLFTKKHGVIRVEEEAGSFYGSINLAASITQKNLRKIKEKDSDHGRHMKGFSRLRVREPGYMKITEDKDEVPSEDDEEEEENEDITDEIVMTKYFDMPPLTVAEAIGQLENVDNDFYGFRNEETGEINILYKREAGGYELIIPHEDGETEKLELPELGSDST
ncbi:Ribosome-binding factor psrp1, chloroplastic [Orobanche gracilis]